MRFCVIVFLIFALFGCAEVHKRYVAEDLDTQFENGVKDSINFEKHDLVFSAQENKELAGKYFGYIEIAIENTSEKWVSIEDIEIDFEEDNIEENTRILSGRDFLAWKEAVLSKKALEDYNKKVVSSLIFTAGLGLAVLSDNQNAQNLGTGVAIGSSASMSISDYRNYKSFNQLENAKIFPENHLLYGKILIPPGYFTRKFLVLDITKGGLYEYIDYMNLLITVNIPDLKKEYTREVKLKFRTSPEESNYSNKSIWQKDLFVVRANLKTISEERKTIAGEPSSIPIYLYTIKKTKYQLYEDISPLIEMQFKSDIKKIVEFEKRDIEKSRKSLLKLKETIQEMKPSPEATVLSNRLLHKIEEIKNGNQDVYKALKPFLQKEFSEELKTIQ